MAMGQTGCMSRNWSRVDRRPNFFLLATTQFETINQQDPEKPETLMQQYFGWCLSIFLEKGVQMKHGCKALTKNYCKKNAVYI